ncbi:hypothetical protein ABZ745_24250 [Streptomyces sp. NPDC013082]|uniref:hypothetical protein n=1 Tax=Streptomyces TaxID=1883 RepID=UPI0029C0B925|nr:MULTISPECIES: hypothetical protein [unclassified Streptomyces]
MPRANRPWRLISGLSKTLAAALATGAIATVSSIVEPGHLTEQPTSHDRHDRSHCAHDRLADRGSEPVASHGRGLAEGEEEDGPLQLLGGPDRGIGVLVCYLGLLVIDFVWALLILNDQVFAAMTRNPLSATEYWTLSWFVACRQPAPGRPRRQQLN